MKKLVIYFEKGSVFAVVFVLIYAAASKLADPGQFELQMHKQLLPPFVQTTIIYLLPPCEIAVAGSMCFERTRMTGLICSFVLFLIFTVYVGAAAFNLFPKRPCSCGGILEHMGWKAHFYFNLFYLTLITTTIIISNRKGVKRHLT